MSKHFSKDEAVCSAPVLADGRNQYPRHYRYSYVVPREMEIASEVSARK
jgi:hypothetical protein